MSEADESTNNDMDWLCTYQPKGANYAYHLNLFEAFDYIDALMKKVEDLETKLKHVQALLDNDLR